MPQQMWNGNQQQQQQQQQQQPSPYLSSMPTRLDYPNPISQYPARQSSQYTDAINSSMPTNNRMINKQAMFSFDSLFSCVISAIQ